MLTIPAALIALAIAAIIHAADGLRDDLLLGPEFYAPRHPTDHAPGNQSERDGVQVAHGADVFAQSAIHDREVVQP